MNESQGSLTDGPRSILQAIVSGGEAWTTQRSLEAAGFSHEDLAALEASHLIERWGLAGEPAWTLSPLGAATFGPMPVELVEDPSGEKLRWGWPSEQPFYYRVPRESRGHGYRIPDEARLVCPAPGPDAYLDMETGRPLMLDPADGEPMVLFGRTVVRDKRLGGGKAKGRPRGQKKTPKLTKAQIVARRNEDWRISHEVGQIDPVTGRLVRRPIAMIAALSGVPERTVRHGIDQARKNLEAVRTAVGAC